jgi:neopullulanase
MTIDTPAWVRDAVFYQVFPDRLERSGRVPRPGEWEAWEATPTVHGFKGGDLYGVIAHLDRLRRLGVDALYLNPVFMSASNHRYHTDDYFSVDPLLGGDEALRTLLHEAHRRDMRVVLDGVFNHCGRGWWPFIHLLENGPASPYREWFHLARDVRDGARSISAFPSDEQMAEMDRIRDSGAAFGVASRQVLGYEAWWDLPALPKLNLEHPPTREHILAVAAHWVEFGIDGWRLDVAEEVSADFWREFRQRVRAIRPDAYLVAEIWHHKPAWLKGDMFDAFMNYPLTIGILGFAGQGHVQADGDLPVEYQGRLQATDAAGLWAIIEELAALNDPAVTSVQLNLLGSHDTPRLRTLLGGGLDAVRLATLLQMTLPGAPCIYYGDEIGLEGGMDPLCRAGFPREPEAWGAEPSGWIADLAGLRRSSRALRDGELSLLRAEGLGIAYLRRWERDVFVVAANAASDELSWDLSLADGSDSVEVLPVRVHGSGEAAASMAGSTLRLRLSPRTGSVVKLNPR